MTKLNILLGIVKVVYSMHFFHILLESGIQIIARTIQKVTQLDLETSTNKKIFNTFNNNISNRFKEFYL